MRAEFEYDVEDLIDVWRRSLRRLNRDISIKPLDVAYLTLAFTSFSYLAGRIAVDYSPRWSALLGLGVGILTVFLLRHNALSTLRKRCLAQMGGASRAHFEIELVSEGYWVRQEDIERLHSWRELEEVRDTSDALEMFTRAGDVTVVRRRAFESQAAYDNFVSEVRARQISFSATNGESNS